MTLADFLDGVTATSRSTSATSEDLRATIMKQLCQSLSVRSQLLHMGYMHHDLAPTAQSSTALSEAVSEPWPSPCAS
jgi:hypothetical protein